MGRSTGTSSTNSKCVMKPSMRDIYSCLWRHRLVLFFGHFIVFDEVEMTSPLRWIDPPIVEPNSVRYSPGFQGWVHWFRVCFFLILGSELRFLDRLNALNCYGCGFGLISVGFSQSRKLKNTFYMMYDKYYKSNRYVIVTGYCNPIDIPWNRIGINDIIRLIVIIPLNVISPPAFRKIGIIYRTLAAIRVSPAVSLCWWLRMT